MASYELQIKIIGMFDMHVYLQHKNKCRVCDKKSDRKSTNCVHYFYLVNSIPKLMLVHENITIFLFVKLIVKAQILFLIIVNFCSQYCGMAPLDDVDMILMRSESSSKNSCDAPAGSGFLYKLTTMTFDDLPDLTVTS